MSKRQNKLPPFVALPWEILNHKAYKDLTFSAAKALPFFLGKVWSPYRSLQRYREPFHLPYSEAQGLGFPKRTFTRVIEELVRKGFIDPVSKGGLKSFGLGFNTFKLSQRWRKYGTSNFETMEWGHVFPDLGRGKKGRRRNGHRTVAKSEPEKRVTGCS